jgi:hypothetical protein
MNDVICVITFALPEGGVLLFARAPDIRLAVCDADSRIGIHPIQWQA